MERKRLRSSTEPDEKELKVIQLGKLSQIKHNNFSKAGQPLIKLLLNHSALSKIDQNCRLILLKYKE